MRVHLINPPGTRPYLRDYHCSKASKAGYVYHPVDLTFQSGIISLNNEICVTDAIAENWGVEKTLKSVVNCRPHAVFCLVGAASWTEDKAFVAKLRQSFDGKIILTGDVFMEKPEEAFGETVADGILLDFTSNGMLEYLKDPSKPGKDMAISGKKGLIFGEKSPKSRTFEIPIPRYDLFPQNKYHYPFVRRRPFATILTDYGCPYPCSYCIMSHVGYKTRPLDNVMEELKWLKRNGFRELYVNDQTFGADRKRCLELLDAMARELLNFGWVCFTRADVLDDEMASAMKRAGCHTVMFGVENASDNILKSYGKKIGADNVAKAFAAARSNGLRTVATFIVGFPEDDAASINATIDLALELDPDFASFNFAVPRRGTELRKRAIEMGLATDGAIEMDQAGETIAMATKYLDKSEMAALRKKAIRSFYLRPGYILKRLASLRNFYEIQTTAREGWHVVRGVFTGDD